jgi:hypothetical protein
MVKSKRKQDDGPVQITVLTGEMNELDRSVALLQKRLNQSKGDDESIDRAAIRIVSATAERKRIKAINRAMGNKSLLQLRLCGGPIAVLINGHQIAGEEMMAIMEIEQAMTALTGAGMVKPVSLELKSAGMKAETSRKTDEVIRRYQKWARFWAARRTYGDRTMEVVERSVVHGHSYRVIEQDLGIRHGQGPKIAVRGLRDYAARAPDWVNRSLANRWMDEALTSFNGKPLDPLSLAIAKAQSARMESLR